MNMDRLKLELRRLPLEQKAILLGGFLAVISVFMPWYSDLDNWGVGNTFSALSGPLYLIGYLILLLGGFSVFTIINKMRRKSILLPFRESLAQIACGALIVFFLLIANSVFFHKDFGVNIIRKETRVGMFICFIGAVSVSLGGYNMSKKKEISRHRSSHSSDQQELLIDLKHRVQRNDSFSESSQSENKNLKLNI